MEIRAKKKKRKGPAVAYWLGHYATNWKAALDPGIYSASNRNEYQKNKNNNVSGE
jgi:hypothetical protein